MVLLSSQLNPIVISNRIFSPLINYAGNTITCHNNTSCVAWIL